MPTSFMAFCRTWGMAAALLLSPGLSRAETKLESPPTVGQPGSPGVVEDAVDFVRDVRPILEQHCFKCHSEQKQHANLRLDERDLAFRGGDSGKKLFDVPAAENELLRRVTDQDPDARMPLEGAPLSEPEIETIRKWAAAGGRWIDAEHPADPAAAKRQAEAKQPDPWYAPVTEFCTPILRDYGSLIFGLVLAALFVGLVEYGKQIGENPEQAEACSMSSLWTYCRKFGGLHYLYLVFALIAWGIGLRELAHARQSGALASVVLQLQGEIKELNKRGKPDPDRRFDPVRPMHPKRLGGEYYRGNDERSDKLFNGGFYRTATFRLALCGADKQPLKLGDPVVGDKLWIKLEIERAKGATPTLFSQRLIDASYLSHYEASEKDNHEDLASEVVHLSPGTPGETWVAYYPLTVPAEADREDRMLSGKVYLYHGKRTDDQVLARPHYGIVYELHFSQGKIVSGSDLWMGSLYIWLKTLELPTPGKLQLNEWFDFRPIPEIEGPNSLDPTLLGVPEHLPSPMSETNPPLAEAGTTTDERPVTEMPPASQ